MADEGFLRKLRAQMGDLSTAMQGRARERPQRVRRTRSVIKHNRFDNEDWRLFARPDKDINNAIIDMFVGDPKEERIGYDNAPELVKDTFLAFLKPAPIMQKKRDVEKDARLNGKFIEQMMRLPEYERLHDQTMTDPMLATMATGAVTDALKEMIKQHREAVEDSNKRKREQEGTGDTPANSSGSDVGDQADNSDSWDEREGDSQDQWEEGENNQTRDGSEQQDQGDGQDSCPACGEQENITNDGEMSHCNSCGHDWEDKSDLEDNVNRAWDEAYLEKFDREDEADLDKMLGEADFGRNINTALRGAAEKLEELDSLRRGVGVEDAEWKQMDPTARLKLATRLNTPQMRTLADLVGRMKRFAMGQQAQKINDMPEEIFDVEMGNDLRRVMRSEFAYLAHPDTRILFVKKYVDGELLQFKERGKEDAGKGPIVVAIDNSGSMSGGPENWAKAVAEALRRICAEQDRDYYAMYFETNRHRERFDFPKGKSDIEKVFKFLSVSAGGGTEFDGVLTEALARIQTQFDDDGRGKGDIVFITDGEAHLDPAWIKNFVEEKQRVGCRVFGVYISAYDSYASSAMKLLSSFCDVVVKVKDLDVNDESTKTIFSHV